MIELGKIKSQLKKFPRHWVVTGSAWASKITSSVIQILSIRALLSYLGEDKYAVYAIVLSLYGWIALSESGIGISLQNFISGCRAKNESYKKYLSTSLQILLLLFAFFFIVLLIVANPVQKILLRKFTYVQGITDTPIIAIVGIVILITALASVVYKVCYAVHKGYISHILPALASVTSMIIIVAVNHSSYVQKGSLLIALLVFTVPQLAFVMIPFIKFFKDSLRDLFSFDKQTVKEILIRAFKFQGITILSTVFLQTDYLIMSQTLSPNEIVTYNIFMKVFLFTSFIYTALIAASWPVFSEMYAKNEISSIKKMLKKYIIYGIIFFTAGTLAIFIFAKPIAEILAPGLIIVPSSIMIFLFGLYMLLRGLTETFSTVIQSANILRLFWIYMPFQIILNIAAQYFLSKHYGINGILAGFSISIILTSLWILPYKMHGIFKSKETENGI